MNIYEKLAAVQQELKAPKDKKNTFAGYNYRSAESILEAVKPVLAKYKATIMMSDSVEVFGDEDSKRFYIKATVQFIDTESEPATSWNADGVTVKRSYIEASAYARETFAKKGLDESQVTGTASSYARKYALNGLLLIDDTKDADTDEYQKQTASEPEKYIKVTSNTPEKAPDSPEKRLSEEKKGIIRTLAKQANIDIEATGEDLDTMTEKRGNAMIVALKNKIGEKA